MFAHQVPHKKKVKRKNKKFEEEDEAQGDEPVNNRDVLILGDCQLGIYKLLDALGWMVGRLGAFERK